MGYGGRACYRKGCGGEAYLTDEKKPLHYNKDNLPSPWFIVR